MARASFGGGGDYSSIFGSLYNQSKALQKSKQDAADQDTYDQWKNGLLSDADWLKYIQGRVDATKSEADPTDHQHWIGLQRQYTVSVADSQAEFGYANGTSSISDLIAYYQGRLTRLQTNSDDYRQLKQHLNDLTDQRDSQDLTTGAQAINDRISSGKATYEDLLKFYQDRLSGLRPSSALYKQVTAEVAKVKTTIDDTKTAGTFEKLQYQYQTKKLSGSSYAAQLTSMAQRYKDSDPQKYYQILEAAAKIKAAGGGGGGGVGSLSKSQKSAEDLLKANDNYFETFSAAYKAGARVIPDPLHPGTMVVLTPELMNTIDTERLANFDKLAAVYKAAGAANKYTTVLENKTKYIVDYVQPHNTVDAAKQWGQLVGSASKQIAAAADSPDPESTLKGVIKSFQTMQGWLQSEVTKNGKLVNAADQPTGDFLNNSSDFISQALSVLTDPNMDSTARSAALGDLAKSLDTDVGANYDKGTVSAMKDLLTKSGAISNGAFDLATGKKTLVITPDKGITLADVKTQHTLAVDPQTGQTIDGEVAVPDVGLSNGQKLQEVWIDKGGTPTKVYAVIDQAPSPYQVWTASKNVTINGQTYKSGSAIPSSLIGQSGFAAAVQAGSLQRTDALAASGNPLMYFQVPAYDDSGKHHDAVTYYQDPQTHMWYQGKPPVSSVDLNSDGTVKLDASGKPAIHWAPFANAGGQAVPYHGEYDRQMQSYYDQGLVGTDPRFNSVPGFRDVQGNFTTDPSKSVSNPAYFDPHDESTHANVYQLQQTQIRDAKSQAALEFTKDASQGPMSFVQQIAATAKGLGLTIGSPETKPSTSSVPSPSWDSISERVHTMQAAAALPKITAAPLPAGKAIDDLALPAFSTGPTQAASLPGLKTTKIDLAGIAANPVATPAPLAGKAADDLAILPSTPSSGSAGRSRLNL